VGWAALLALIAYDVTSSIGRSREEGSLDVMLLVPESDRFVARALFVAYLRRSLLFLPALAARGLPLLLSWLSPPSGMFPPGYLGYIVASVLSGIALLPVFVALGCLASTWRLSSATQAFAITFGYLAFRQVLYMPLSMFLTPWLGGWLGTMLVVPVRSALITIATIAIGWVAYWLFVRRIGTAWRIGGDVTWHGDWEI